MMTRTAEHIHIAMEICSCLLFAGAFGILRQRRYNIDRLTREHTENQRSLLKQKDLLIREIHHRVANQLGLTAAMLHLHATRSSHPDAKAHLFEGENRIRTLSRLHTRLRQTNSLSDTLLYPYLSDLARDLISTLRPDLVYKAEFSSKGPCTKTSTAVTCGLLVHELVTNSIKHAFPHDRIGTICLTLNHTIHNQLRISIRDNGTGLPSGFTLHDPPSSGMTIISALTQDLAGTFTVVQHPSGAEFIAEFPLS